MSTYDENKSFGFWSRFLEIATSTGHLRSTDLSTSNNYPGETDETSEMVNILQRISSMRTEMFHKDRLIKRHEQIRQCWDIADAVVIAEKIQRLANASNHLQNVVDQSEYVAIHLHEQISDIFQLDVSLHSELIQLLSALAMAEKRLAVGEENLDAHHLVEATDYYWKCLQDVADLLKSVETVL